MNNKKFGVFLILGLLVLSMNFISAGWFSDAWNTITGNAISSSDCNSLVPLYRYYSSSQGYRPFLLECS